MPVIDANLVVEWLIPLNPDHPAIIAIDDLIAEGSPILAPPLLPMEARNALLSGLRRGTWDGLTADRAHDDLRSMPIQIAHDPSDLDRAWDLARRYDDHPVYDMVYVAMAERSSMTFITADARLRRRLVDLDFVVSPEELIA